MAILNHVAWIDTKQRKPKPGTDVLGHWPCTGFPMTRYVLDVVTYAGRGIWHDPENDEDDYAEPSHWAELPEPPAPGSLKGE